MSIRLNKVLTQLNIGLQTAIEFLRSRKNLGEVKDNATLTTKITDVQFDALKKEFSNDKEIKEEAQKLINKNKKSKENKTEKKETIAESPVTPKTQYKPEGNSVNDDIDKETPAPASDAQENIQVNAPVKQEATPAVDVPQETQPSTAHNEPQTTPAADDAVTTKEAEPQEPKEPEIEKPEPEKAQEAPATSVAEEKEEPAVEEKNQGTTPEPKGAIEEQQAEKDQTTDKPSNKQSKFYITETERKMAPKFNVVGQINLGEVDTGTRPKNTKEGKRPEHGKKNGSSNDRKKREHIKREKVDVASTIAIQDKQAQQAGGKNKGDNRYGQNGYNNKYNRTRGKGRNQQSSRPADNNGEDMARQVKERLASYNNGKNLKKGAKYRRDKREAEQKRLNEEMKEQQTESKTLKLTEFVTVSELATMMNVPVNKVIGTCMSVGIMVSINQRLNAETINLVADEFGFTTEYVSAQVSEAISEEEDDENDLVPRIPVVTVMGHVDHGKTSLLDNIRNSNLIAGEAGGITQHIGAYNVTLSDGRRITFLDTPGHEAFTAMRARGAQVTDIAIIIIAADDSVMPTTREAIAHAQAANVPMVFAINKIDKPGANPDKIREDLANMNLLVEEWGGKYQCQEISAKKGIGVKDLLEKVLLEAEMLDLKANPNRKATGTIIESKLDKGRGYMSTVLVSNGTLKVGDMVIAGTCYGRIKAMFNERNANMEKALPAEPCMILGLNGAPSAGDTFHVMASEQEAKEIANKREQLQREQGLRTQKRVTLADISHRIALGSFKELNLIVKGDTDGSVEALSDSFIKLSTEKIKVNVIYKAVGQISEGDVELAYASDAIIVGFQVRPSSAARKLAEKEGVDINTYSIIYDAIDDIRSAMEGMLDKIKKEVVTGQAEVKEVYHISKVGTVAGAYVSEGKVHRGDKIRVIRDGIVMHTGDINALKRFKDDVKEVAANFECGISLVNFNDIQSGDIMESFTEIEVQQKL